HLLNKKAGVKIGLTFAFYSAYTFSRVKGGCVDLTSVERGVCPTEHKEVGQECPTHTADAESGAIVSPQKTDFRVVFQSKFRPSTTVLRVLSLSRRLNTLLKNTGTTYLATTDYISAQTLPANIEAERSILGAILLDNLAYNQAAEHRKAEDFLLDSHRRIYSRMVDLAESSRAIDQITLAEELDRHGEFDTIGGYAYISGLLGGVPDR